MGNSITAAAGAPVSMPLRAFCRTVVVSAVMMVVACNEFPVTALPLLKLNVQVPLPDTLTVTDTAYFDVSVRDESGNHITHATITARSSDTSVVSVAPNRVDVDDIGRFVITARSAGVAEISLAVEGGTGVVEVQGFQDTVLVNEHWKSVSIGNARACGVTTNARAYCWGDGINGLGDGSIQSSSRPIRVLTSVRVKTISVGPSGASQTCLTDDTDLAYCWGRNRMGEVGDGTQLQRVVPVPADPGATFVSLAAGDQFTCGVTVPGPSYCWGEADFGELGNGSFAGNGSCFFDISHIQACIPSPKEPVQTVHLNPDHPEVNCISLESCHLALTSISASNLFACGLTAVGKVFCWGVSRFVGGPPLGGSCTLQPCSSLATLAGGTADWPTTPYTGPLFVSVSVGGEACALEQGGRLFCWGRDFPTPTPIATPLRFRSISVGFTHSCALTDDGTAYCWGTNEFGQLGTGSTGPATNAPSPVTGQRKYSSIAAGTFSTCAVSIAGPLYCWGKGDFGQLGTGETKHAPIPTRVMEPLR